MILDPLMILGIGPFPRLEVAGAALATIIAQFCVTVIFIIKAQRTKELFTDLKLFKIPDMDRIKAIVKLGFPAGLQSGMFTIFAMSITRDNCPMGTHTNSSTKSRFSNRSHILDDRRRISNSNEYLVGQNYGAKKWPRVVKSYIVGMSVMSVIGLLATGLLVFAARPLFSIFIDEEETIRHGIVYLRILGISQLFMCLESTTAGAFNGLGKTIPPSIVGISFNALRIPAALILSATSLGLNGVWWAVSISSIFKGTVLTTWFILMLNRNPETKGLSIANLLRG